MSGKYMVRHEVKNGYQQDTWSNGIRLCAQNSWIVIVSIENTIGRVDKITQEE
jgi:hypothetical protein